MPVCAGDHSRIAFIGAGGKTTLSEALAQAFAKSEPRVALTTTTHFFLPESMPTLIAPAECDILAAWRTSSLVAVCGDETETNIPTPRKKMRGPDADILRFLFWNASRVVIEADGARGRLLKLHGVNEPAVPADTELVYIVASMAALGRPLGAVCHRRERIEAVFHKDANAITTADDIADCIGAVDRSGFLRVCAVLNCVTEEGPARRVSDRLRDQYGMDSVWVPMLPDDAARQEAIAACLMRR